MTDEEFEAVFRTLRADVEMIVRVSGPDADLLMHSPEFVGRVTDMAYDARDLLRTCPLDKQSVVLSMMYSILSVTLAEDMKIRIQEPVGSRKASTIVWVPKRPEAMRAAAERARASRLRGLHMKQFDHFEKEAFGEGEKS